MAQEVEIRGPIKDESAIKKVIQEITNGTIVVEPVSQIAVFLKHEGASYVIRWSEGDSHFEFIYKKKTKDVENLESREEITTLIHKSQVSEFLMIMSHLGLTEGLVSAATRFEFSNDSVSWSFKLNTQVGNYWEAEATPKLGNQLDGDVTQILTKLKEITDPYQLETWTEQEFKDHYKNAWAGVEYKPMYEIIELLKGRLPKSKKH